MFFSFMYGQNCYCYVKPAYKKDDFVRAGTQTSYVGDEAVKSRERAAIHLVCYTAGCVADYNPLGLPLGYVTLYHVSLASSQWECATLGYVLIKRYGKTDDKNVQLTFCNIAALKRVEKRCCAFYRLQFKPVLLQIRLLFRSLQQPDLFSEGRFDSWVVKRATSLFNSFFSNVAKQVAGFCCPFIP